MQTANFAKPQAECIETTKSYRLYNFYYDMFQELILVQSIKKCVFKSKQFDNELRCRNNI